jgi:cellulose synthase/poly-beta-1,6-N-acetylglucosamine synthase-like glycosyltransferase
MAGTVRCVRQPNPTDLNTPYAVRLPRRLDQVTLVIDLKDLPDDDSLLGRQCRILIVDSDPGLRRLAALAERLGVRYLARPTVEHQGGKRKKVGGHGKAGNHKYAFCRTCGAYILMLDADFLVHRSFLYRTLGFLLYRSDVGLVQTPQRFYNSDVIARNLFAPHCVPEEQHFFMTVTQLPWAWPSVRSAWLRRRRKPQKEHIFCGFAGNMAFSSREGFLVVCPGHLSH